LPETLFPREHWPFLLRNEGICVIATAVLLRYFYITHEWQRHVRAEARSRIEALQARIRPHFLFNSLNTIAALTRSDAQRAEEAVEDLADLFRATLRDSHSPLRLKEEFELTASTNGSRSCASASASKCAGTSPTCRCERSCRVSRFSRCSRTRSITASSRSIEAGP
jgi:hypothetical protein